jgi:hypothetical protein
MRFLQKEENKKMAYNDRAYYERLDKVIEECSPPQDSGISHIHAQKNQPFMLLMKQ